MKLLVKYTLFILFFLFLITTCEPFITQTTGSFTLCGSIYDESDHTISNVNVDFIEISGTFNYSQEDLNKSNNNNNWMSDENGYYMILEAYTLEYTEDFFNIKPKECTRYIDYVKVKFSKASYIDKIEEYHFDDVEDPGIIYRDVVLESID